MKKIWPWNHQIVLMQMMKKARHKEIVPGKVLGQDSKFFIQNMSFNLTDILRQIKYDHKFLKT